MFECFGYLFRSMTGGLCCLHMGRFGMALFIFVLYSRLAQKCFYLSFHQAMTCRPHFHPFKVTVTGYGHVQSSTILDETMMC